MVAKFKDLGGETTRWTPPLRQVPGRGNRKMAKVVKFANIHAD